jgi:hypothetical protein
LGVTSSRPRVSGIFSRVPGKPGIFGFSPDTLGFVAGGELAGSSISQS